MAHQIVLEFVGVDPAMYWKANEALGIDVAQTEGWPDGITHHAAGPTDDGGFVVTEIWETREHQAAFMEERLGPVLAEVGIPPPARVTWTELLSDRRL